MKIKYNPISPLEKLGAKVYLALTEKYPQTFYVGGMVRDLLLARPVVDIDMTTAARPEEIVRLLEQAEISYDAEYARFGVIAAYKDASKIEITTLREDLPSTDRYADVRFITDPETDSRRRDFTLNSLYLNGASGEVLDFHNGLGDIEHKLIRAVGNPVIRFTEDPLRMIRAMRFASLLNFTIEPTTNEAIQKCAHLITALTESKIKKEINKISDTQTRKQLQKLINSLA